MVNPVKYHLSTRDGIRTIDIEPVLEEITGGDLFPTGRYLLHEENNGAGEMRFDGELFEWEWDGIRKLEDENMFSIAKFIQEYIEPELVLYEDSDAY